MKTTLRKMTGKPRKAEEGDMYEETETGRLFYFTNGRWLDVTSKERPIQKE